MTRYRIMVMNPSEVPGTNLALDEVLEIEQIQVADGVIKLWDATNQVALIVPLGLTIIKKEPR